MYQYKAFGLKISSEIPINELIPYNTDQPDLILRKGIVPDTLEDIVVDKPNRKIGKDSFLLKIPGIAAYYVEKGERIIIEPQENALQEGIKTYLLGSCMGAVLYQRRILPLHGSCINMNDKGVLITGQSGAGKSTISSVLYNHGYRMITDDVAAVKIEGQEVPTVYPSYPGQKLWEDALERIGRNEEKKPLNRILNNMNKYSIHSEAYYCNEPKPIKVIFEIIPDSVEKVSIEKLSGIDKLNLVMENAYRNRFPQHMGLREWYFKQCVSVANHITAYQIRRPKNQHLENEIAEMIMETVR